MTIYSSKKQLPTLIFDEIDSGVSGDVAGRIGLLLRKMGGSRQLMAITHLPQVAASGHNHLSVRKSEDDGRTSTEVVPLSLEEKREEIARLMSGKELTAAAVENANELMKSHDI
jgi:DNA repair protein RecN (Recombination protein N)